MYWTRRELQAILKACNIPHSRFLSSVNVQAEQHSSVGTKHRHSRRPRVYLGTLNPSKLRPEDFLDLSNKWAHTVRFNDLYGYGGYKIRTLDTHRFPEYAKGFLYYNVPRPPFPPIMGDVKFRITPSSDPSSFDSGTDLPRSRDEPVPYSLPLLHLAKSATHQTLCEQLVAEGLVSRNLLEECLSLNSLEVHDRRGRIRSFLYHMNQTFFSTFDSRYLYFSFWVVGKEKLLPYTPKNPFYSSKKFVAGSGFFRFERLDDESLGIRLIKSIEPARWITQDKRFQGRRIDLPVEGELIRKGGKIFTITLDNENTKALRDLL